MMKEIRLHGRGGQGAVIAAQILTRAFYAEGKYASSFPMFGFERRGAPVAAFTRVDDKPIREKSQIYTPDCLLVLAPSLEGLPMLFDGLKREGILVMNSVKLPEKILHGNLRIVGAVNATAIAQEEIGMPATNTCMLGAFAKTTGWVKLASVLAAFEDYFKGKLLERNVRSAERGFGETEVRLLHE